MSNRFATISLIIVVSIIGACILFVIGLFLFPGLYLFGIKYVGLNTHAVQTGKVEIYDKVGSFSGIVLNTYEVPVEVVFSGENTYMLEYYDNYNGITSTDLGNPSIAYSKDDDGNAVISITEYRTFIYESSTSTRYVKLYIPLHDVVNSGEYQKSIIINSTKSSVKFCKAQEGESRIPRLYSVELTTNGKVTYETEVKARKFAYTTNNSILIDRENENCVNATDSYTLISNRGSITVEKDTVGNLTAKTDQGNILFRTCGHLNAETRYGKIDYAYLEGEEKGTKAVTINGLAKINARAGNVTIGEIKASSGQNEITTSSGHIVISKLRDGTVTTKRGLVNIKTARDLTVISNTGKVYVEEATAQLDVQTVRANIYLGGDNMVMKDVTVFTRIGKVTMYSSTGYANIETLSSDVTYSNISSSNIKIKCGGKLVATGLQGAVDISAEKNVELSFASIDTNNVTIALGNGCSVANISALNSLKDEVNYFMSGKKVFIQENQNNNAVTLEEKERYEVNADSSYMFKVTGANAVITICFKSSI